MPVLRTKTCGGFPSIRGRSNRFKRASVCSFSPTGGRERRLTSSHQSVCVFLSPRRACRPKTTREGGRQRRHHLLFRPDPQLGAPQPLPGHRGPLVGLLSPPFRPAMSRRRGGEEKGGGEVAIVRVTKPAIEITNQQDSAPSPGPGVSILLARRLLFFTRLHRGRLSSEPSLFTTCPSRNSF